MELTGIVIAAGGLGSCSALVAGDDGVVVLVDLPDEVGGHLVQAGVVRLAATADFGDTATVTSLIPHAKVLFTSTHFDEACLGTVETVVVSGATIVGSGIAVPAESAISDKW